MDIKFIKLVLRKDIDVMQSNYSEQYYHKALHEFIYDMNGCIAGWNMERITTDRRVLSFACTTENEESDLEYLNKWIAEVKNVHNVHISDNMKISGEIVINFENE